MPSRVTISAWMNIGFFGKFNSCLLPSSRSFNKSAIALPEHVSGDSVVATTEDGIGEVVVL